MSRPEDGNYAALHALNLHMIFRKADDYFVQFTDVEETILTDECNLSEKITEFLSEWKAIVDVTAIQQNIHHHLSLTDGQ
jgi:hypothetical protein